MSPHPTAQGDPHLYPPVLNPEQKAPHIGLFLPWTEQESCQKEPAIVNSYLKELSFVNEVEISNSSLFVTSRPTP